MKVPVLSLLPCLFLPGWAPPLTPQGVQEALPDADIRVAVERELLHDEAVDPQGIDVGISAGIVELDGHVDSLLQKRRAALLAETVKGVRAVVDRLEVRPFPPRTDEQMAADVREALLEDPATDSYEVTVNVHEGHVVLTGTVDSWTERRLCATAAEGVRGVRELSNDIRVHYTSDRPDGEILAEIDRTLDWDVLVDARHVRARVEGGNVTLSGTVGSAAEKTRAELDSWTAGVRTVTADGLRVEPWARDPDRRTSTHPRRTDEEILLAVEGALAHDPRVSTGSVSPRSAGGIVTLQGVVANLEASRAAQQDARNTVGVIAVQNHLKVRPEEERPAEDIVADVRSALLRDPYVSRFDVNVSVNKGTVHLTGSVDSTFEKAQADELASRVRGVTDVDNDLRVDLRPYSSSPYLDPWRIDDFDWYRLEPFYTRKSDQQLERDVEDELFWSPFVDSDRIRVEVDDGVVTLSGQADTWMERGAAQDNAYDAGATHVRNQIRVGTDSALAGGLGQ